MLEWDIYELSSEKGALTGVFMRFKTRKFALENNFNLIIDNAGDKEGCVRIGVLVGEDISLIQKFVKSLVPDVKFDLILPKLKNPILSIVENNFEERDIV